VISEAIAPPFGPAPPSLLSTRGGRRRIARWYAGAVHRAAKSRDLAGLPRAVPGEDRSVPAGDTLESSMELRATTTVHKEPLEVYEFWRRLDNLPSFMAHLDDVRTTGDRTSHWTATAPFGRTVEWDAETTEDLPGERIAWRSTGDADVENAGSVQFVRAPGGRGTEVHVTIRYDLPGGKLGELVARYFGEEPHQALDDDLRRFKQVLETGEVVRSDGAPYGKRARKEFPQRPAQPMSPTELAEVDE
jgi:uncharacterized membrane protein